MIRLGTFAGALGIASALGAGDVASAAAFAAVTLALAACSRWVRA